MSARLLYLCGWTSRGRRSAGNRTDVECGWHKVEDATPSEHRSRTSGHCSWKRSWRHQWTDTWLAERHLQQSWRFCLHLSQSYRQNVGIYSTHPSIMRASVSLLSAQCISSFGQIIKSVCVSHKTSWTLYRSQASTDLHQTHHQGRVPEDVVIYCFWWKSEIFLSAKPEVELILTIAPMEKYL